MTWLTEVLKFFDKKASGGVATLVNKSVIKNENLSNKELAKKLHKPINGKFEKRTVHSPFIENTWGADIANINVQA